MSIMKVIEQAIEPTAGAITAKNRDWLWVAGLVALGAVLRFWGLDNVGLHGDEETMAMPAMAILENRGPYLPSGMFYPRALAQVYLMAASVWVFGESEWALRLPSAIIGSLMPLLAFFLGRRFLSSPFNVMFVAIVALFPALIDYSQTARMYVFWLAALMVFGSCLFRWERDNSMTSLVVAFVAWLVALHFHALSILAAPLFLFPGMVRKSWANLIQGAIAIGVCIYAYEINGNWIGAAYPDSSERPLDNAIAALTTDPTLVQSSWYQQPWLLVAAAVIAGALLIWACVKAFRYGRLSAVAVLLASAAGLVACLALHYHVGILALILGTVIWLRNSVWSVRWLQGLWGVTAIIAAVQAYALFRTGEYPGRQLIGAMVGEPSIWPMLRFAEYSPMAAGLYGLVLVYGIYRLATRHKIPDHLLFFAMSVWLPLLAIGFATWYLPPRYTAGALPFFLLCCVAGLEYLFRSWEFAAPTEMRKNYAGAAIAALLVFRVANPVGLLRVVNDGYERHPDHKGAAEYLKSLPITNEDVIIAEDVLQQTYYLGGVDYWLRNFENARGYAVATDDGSVDQYTATPIIGTGDELIAILEKNRGKRVFIISNGEVTTDRDEWARGRGIGEVLDSTRLSVVYEGRDGLTKVWLSQQ